MDEELELAGPQLALPETQQSMPERALELFQAGGPVVAILTAMSVLALAIVLVKLWQFRGARIGDRRTAHEALRLYRGEALPPAPPPFSALLHWLGRQDPDGSIRLGLWLGWLAVLPLALTVVGAEALKGMGRFLSRLRARLRGLLEQPR